MQVITQLPQIPDRPANAHKGIFGTVIVIGGCDTMIGAPAICARSAFRTGSGLVKIACPPSVLPHALTVEPSATGVRLAGDVGVMMRSIEQADPDGKAVLAVGPGLGQSADWLPLIAQLIAGARPVVLDADGLNLLAELPLAARRPTAPLVLTPHPGEFRRLAESLNIGHSPIVSADRVKAAAELAAAWQATVLLKGQHSVITDHKHVYTNQTGNPALATAGSGDVLTGVIASFMAQGLGAFDAACLGAHVHGLAADRWAQAHGACGMRAMDLADQIPDALEQCRE